MAFAMLVGMPGTAQAAEDADGRTIESSSLSLYSSYSLMAAPVYTVQPVLGNLSDTAPVYEVAPVLVEAAIDSDVAWAADEAPYAAGNSLQHIVSTTGAATMHSRGFDGTGIDIAMIDSGVVPVPGLNQSGKLIHGPDLSFESQAENLIHLDTYGHGTHVAGVIASTEGMAPGSRLISLKVADAVGATDVSQVIAAIDWVVEHRNDNGMNIKVLNISFGTDGTQPYQIDPLAFAVERAWHAGIVVVVAAGNDGNAAPLRNPASNPYVIAVGATDSRGTDTRTDDVVADFSNCGTADRSVDLVAPGVSLRSLRSPGSEADQTHPDARVYNDYFKGSGTSQGAGVVSGAAALILDARPWLTPDRVKALLTTTAGEVDGSLQCQGAGTIDLMRALKTRPPQNVQSHDRSTGLGTLNGARGSMVLVHDDVALDGEQDVMGNSWVAEESVKRSLNGASWSGGDWNGASWSGASWSGASWSGASWSGASWSGASWSGASWSGASWSGASWSGASWSGASWSGASWSGSSWSGSGWSGSVWG
jgi:serine protease AprX